MFGRRILYPLMMFILASNLLAGIWNVSVTGSDVSGDGSEGSPYASIQTGINASQNGDTVLVHDGLYQENIDFSGKRIVLSSEGGRESTIIDGQASSFVIRMASLEDSTTIIDGFTIQNGNYGLGGGIICQNADPILRNLTIQNNVATDHGGGVIFHQSRAKLFNVQINDNTSGGDGGGAYLYINSDVYFQDVQIGNNTSAEEGGGIGIDNCQLQLENCRIYNNYSPSKGGGIWAFDGRLTIGRSVIENNSTDDDGGGIAAHLGCEFSLHGSTVSGNTAGLEGGGLYLFNNSSVDITYTLIADNIASTNGGGYVIRGNNDSPYFQNNTITNNYANNSQVSEFLDEDASLSIYRNSIIWDSGPGQFSINYNYDAQYCIFPVGWAGAGINITNIEISHLNPLFVFPDTANYSLQLNSPCIDTGDPDLDEDDLIYYLDPDDQDPDGTRMGMGAYYFHQTPAYDGPIWHISVAGSDATGDGSAGNPFASIQMGVESASQGDTIQVGSGTFPDPINVQSKSLTILGGDSSATIIAADQITLQSHSQAQMVSFQNLGFQSNGSGDDYMIWTECTDCSGADSFQVEFLGVSGEGSHAKGFLLAGQRTQLLASHSRFHGFSNPAGNGAVFNLASSSAEFDHCAFSDNSVSGDGQVLYATDSSTVNIRFSSFSGNGTSAGSIALSDGASVVLSNSILWGTPNFQLVVLDEGAACSASISYCDYANGQFGIEDQSGDLDLTWGPGNFSQAPQFVSAGDLNLQANSPCIDAGNPDGDGDGSDWQIDTDDQDPDGTRFDLGAFFYDQRDTIPPLVQLNIPELTEVLENGDTLLITWSASDNVALDWAKLFFTSNAGLSFSLIDSVDANLGELEWIAPDIMADTCRFAIWVSDLSGNISADTLAGSFAIHDGTPPIISISNPNQSTSVREYDSLAVSWEVQDNLGIDHVLIWYSRNPPSEPYIGIADITDGSTSYPVQIRSGITDNARFKLLAFDLSENVGFAESEPFSVTDGTHPVISYVSIPDTLDWAIGTWMDIQVTASDNVEVTGLDLNYSQDDGATWIPIVEDLYPVQGRPTYSWLIPDIPGSCKIQAIVSDAVGLTAEAYSDNFSIMVVYPQLVASLPLIAPWDDIHLLFTQPMEAVDLSLAAQVIGSVGGVYEISGVVSGEHASISAPQGFASLDTLMIVLSSTEWVNAFGYGLDGNGDGVWGGDPGDNDTVFTSVSAAGDYNQDQVFNFADFSDFVLAWHAGHFQYELAPHTRDIPHISIQPDSVFDIFDLATFAAMWNWSVGLNPSPPLLNGFEMVTLESEQSGNRLTLALDNDAYLASQTIITYDPSIVAVALEDPDLAKVSSTSLVLVDSDPDSGYIVITSSQESGPGEAQLELSLTPRTQQAYFIEIGVQGLDGSRNITRKRSSIDLLPIPTTFSLSQNYPNPFNASTTIAYGLPQDCDLSLAIYDLKGRLVKDIYSGRQAAGYHSSQWTGTNNRGQNVASGLYFIVLQTPESRFARKALILK